MTVVETNKSIGPSHHQVKPLAPHSPDVDRSIVSSIVSSIVAPSIGQVNQENSTAGNDKLLRTKDDNVLRGKADQDQLLGGAGRDRLLGSRGQDYLHGSEGNDRLLGRAGQDQLIGGSGNDTLLGHKGDDRLFGQSGRDHLRGGRGHDQLNGGTGHDRLFGGTGCDRLIDKDGGDRLVGGAGNDEFWIGNGVQGVTQIQDFQVGRDRLRFMQLGITYEDLTFERQDRHTVISFQDQQLVHLKNIYPSQLQSSSFDFGDPTLIPTLKTALDTSLAPGATLAVVMGDGSVWRGAAGIADLENGTPMSVDATMDIGSITKPMVAVTLLQLMQEDRVSLDDTLGQWLPDVSGKIENSETITLRQLLNHSSGIPDFLDDDFLAAIVSDPDHIWMPEDFLQLAYGESSDFAPGERHSYSNTNYTLLGLIIEAVTGDTLAGQLRSRIFAPLGMNDSSVVSESSMPGDFLRGYLDLAEYDLSEASEIIPVFFHPTAQGFGEGGVVSSVADLARFSEALNNGELLAPQTFEQMQQESIAVDEDDQDRYGLGIDLLWTPNGTAIGHSGGFPGAGSLMYFMPEQQITIVTIENQEEAAGQPFIKTFRALLEATTE